MKKPADTKLAKTPLTFMFKTVYGRSLYYPLGTCEKLLCDLAKKDTMTLEQITILKKLRYKVNIVQYDPLSD